MVQFQEQLILHIFVSQKLDPKLILLPGAAVSGRGLRGECGCECDVDEVLVRQLVARPRRVHVVVRQTAARSRDSQVWRQNWTIQGVRDRLVRLHNCPQQVIRDSSLVESHWNFGEIVNPEWWRKVVSCREDDTEGGVVEADLHTEES